jgi:hypothetical protein
MPSDQVLAQFVDRSGPDGDQELSGAGHGNRSGNDLVKEELMVVATSASGLHTMKSCPELFESLHDAEVSSAITRPSMRFASSLSN